MSRADIILWRAAGIVALALAFVCLAQLASAAGGVHIRHLVGWTEGFPCALVAAYACRIALEEA